MAKCLGCTLSPTKEQPTYCERCFLPVPIPEPKIVDSELLERQHNRASLAKELHMRKPGAMDFVKQLGLEQLPLPDLASAFSSIGMEKLHFLSGEYNWREAQTMVDLGYGLAQLLDPEWVRRITKLRLAQQLIRGGWLDQALEHLLQLDAVDLGEDLTSYEANDRVVRVFENIEIQATIALAKQFRDQHSNADSLQNQVMHLWELMKPRITDIITKEKQSSFYMGIQDSAFDVPRLDKLAFYQTILVHEAIASSQLRFSDKVFERLLTLGRMVIILGEMSPPDDPPFYSAVLREYFQLCNGLLWYPEAIQQNDLDLIQKTILQAHAISLQWMYIIPGQYWIQVRPSRFLEIFYEAMTWSDQLNPKPFIDHWLSIIPREYKPYALYLIGQAQLNSNLKELGEGNLLQAIEMKETPDDLQAFIRDLLQKSMLESEGIVLNAPFQSKLDRLHVILEVPSGVSKSDEQVILPSVLIDSAIVFPDPEDLMAVSFDSASKFFPKQVSVFGERLENVLYNTPNTAHQYFNQSIIVVGTQYYRDVHWQTPFEAIMRRVNGIRSDVLVFRILHDGQSISFLFEGGEISITKSPEADIIETPGLYHLTGVKTSESLESDIILEYLANLLNKTLKFQQLDIYSLKIDL